MGPPCRACRHTQSKQIYGGWTSYSACIHTTHMYILYAGLLAIWTCKMVSGPSSADAMGCVGTVYLCRDESGTKHILMERYAMTRQDSGALGRVERRGKVELSLDSTLTWPQRKQNNSSFYRTRHVRIRSDGQIPSKKWPKSTTLSAIF